LESLTPRPGIREQNLPTTEVAMLANIFAHISFF
jgi:hypothetical protein